jgi:hypothetical protein
LVFILFEYTMACVPAAETADWDYNELVWIGSTAEILYNHNGILIRAAVAVFSALKGSKEYWRAVPAGQIERDNSP